MVFDRRLSHALPIGYQIQGSSSINWRLLSLIEPLSLRNEVLGAVALAIQVSFKVMPLYSFSINDIIEHLDHLCSSARSGLGGM